MELIYVRIRQRARQIASRYPLPDFYKDFPAAHHISREFFETNPVICQLSTFVSERLEDNLGHGLEHAVKVTLDAGSLILIQGNKCKDILHSFESQADTYLMRRVMIAQCAGLLHDIRRKEENHAVAGAAYAREILKNYPLMPHEREDICQAIRNHEAFKDTVKINTLEGQLISDSLYDADKFRWGPDNFTDTIWHMVAYSQTPLSQFMEFYPQGMKMLENAKSLFRSDTGKKYGPQFIDLGLAIGEELYDVIVNYPALRGGACKKLPC